MKAPRRLPIVALLVWASACHISNICTFGNNEGCPLGASCYAGENAKLGDDGICVYESKPLSPEAGPATLLVEIVPSIISFSPMEMDGVYNGRSATVKVVVSGFANRTDANSVQLEIGHLDKPAWLSLGGEESEPSDNSITFRVGVQYGGSTFTEPPGSINLRLNHIPEGYGYGNETQSIRVVVGDGQKAHPIGVNQANVEAFNLYARTNGLALHYQLMEDIVLLPSSENEDNWTAIGTGAAPFTGSFDGEGHTISGLRIRSAKDYQGLFGHIEGSAEITNLGLINVSVAAAETGSISFVGGLVGASRGTVRNSYATGNVTGTGTNGPVGGLVGINGGTVRNSYATGNVTGTGANSFVGGLMGLNSNGTVQSSYATGNVTVADTDDISYVGGLVGANGGTVQDSYATGNVTAVDTSGISCVGGLVGANGEGILQNSYATGNVTATDTSGISFVGGLVGTNGLMEIPIVVFGTVQNSVALNASAAVSDINVGRVVGRNTDGSTLFNNHARRGMMLSHNNGTNYTPTSGATLKDGVSTSEYGEQGFWIGLGWDFKERWEWGPQGLPILRNVGGTQNPTVQPLVP
ncbi:MAG: hypothetical protein FWD46_01035 [Cystobacterineae bacterium]|nr:hypothetical protein [Cystobacterineae bacterium]